MKLPAKSQSVQKENRRPIVLPQLGRSTSKQPKPNRDTLVLTEFVHRYFRRKSESSCLQILKQFIQQPPLNIRTQQTEDTSAPSQFLQPLHNDRHLRKRQRHHRKSHLRSQYCLPADYIGNGQAIHRQSCIDQYFQAEYSHLRANEHHVQARQSQFT